MPHLGNRAPTNERTLDGSFPYQGGHSSPHSAPGKQGVSKDPQGKAPRRAWRAFRLSWRQVPRPHPVGTTCFPQAKTAGEPAADARMHPGKNSY